MGGWLGRGVVAVGREEGMRGLEEKVVLMEE